MPQSLVLYLYFFSTHPPSPFEQQLLIKYGATVGQAFCLAASLFGYRKTRLPDRAKWPPPTSSAALGAGIPGLDARGFFELYNRCRQTGDLDENRLLS